jgi:hypothetical protein
MLSVVTIETIIIFSTDLSLSKTNRFSIILEMFLIIKRIFMTNWFSTIHWNEFNEDSFCESFFESDERKVDYQLFITNRIDIFVIDCFTRCFVWRVRFIPPVGKNIKIVKNQLSQGIGRENICLISFIGRPGV